MAKGVPRNRCCITLLSVFSLLTTTIILQTRTSHCPPTLIFSAPHHGASWLLNSTDSCMHASQHPYPTLLNVNNSLPKTLSHSLVMFPPLDPRARELFRLNAPVVVLRRDVAGAYRSYLEGGGITGWEEWVEDIDGYFEEVNGLLVAEGIKAEWIWYNDAFQRSRILMKRHTCHVDNCALRKTTELL